ncbi:MAG TPA: hypothetical protein VMH38_01775, partial [Thermoplasmata archaeon]|nr:hypothetical protein [Thermoplasmata archaeon]
DAREAMLGHSLGVSGRYNLSKRLPPKLIEMLRDEYERALDELLIERHPQRSDVERLEMGLWSTVLESLGFTPAEAAEVAGEGELKVKEAIRQRMGTRGRPADPVGTQSSPLVESETIAPNSSRPREHDVALAELDDWLDRGAEFLGNAGPDRVVVRLR